MKAKHMVMIIVLLLFAIIAGASLYVVREGQQAIILQLGKLAVDSKTKQPLVTMPGLHIKKPFIETVKRFDVRLQTLESSSSRIVTAMQKDVLVDYFVKWCIVDPALYYKSTNGNLTRAKALLDQQVGTKLRAEFGKRTIAEVVSDDRLAIMEALRTSVNVNANVLGIRVTDVRIKRIDLPEEVSHRVFERMRQERKVVATEHRATGQAQAEAIEATAKGDALIKVSQAQTDAAAIRAEGDAFAAQIYLTAYDKEPEFYTFYRSVNAYKEVFSNKRDILVLQPNSHFFKYFGSEQSNQTLRQAKRVS